MAEVSLHTNERYWLLRGACLNNLYGVDIIAEAAEIAKLRLFLKLIAQLDDLSQVEPLPDLDFNIRSGNMLVGLADPQDAERRFGEGQLPLAPLNEATIAAGLAAEAYQEFIRDQAADIGEHTDPATKKRLQIKINKATDIADKILHEARTEQIDIKDWKQSHQPFHWFAQFPAVWLKDGFDVIIGNPPYIRTKGKGRHSFDYTWYGYNTHNCPDLYAVCTERASTLLNPQGRFAMIIMYSACFGGEYTELRTYLSKWFNKLYISAFTVAPTGLFRPSATVRNCIVIGSRARAQYPGRVITGIQRWVHKARPILFHRIAYANSAKLMDQVLNTWGLPGAPLVAEAFEHLCRRGHKLSNSYWNRGHPLWFKATARYMLSSYIEEPPSFDQNGNPAPQTGGAWMHFRSGKERDMAFLIMTGRWMFLWWLAIGDEFHVTKQVLGSFPADLESLSDNDSLLELAQELRDEAPDHLFWVRMAGRKVGNYDLRKCRHITDEADWLLAQAWGFTREQFDAAGNLRDRMAFKPKD